MIIKKNRAIEILKKGGNVIIPTETVYGLAASIWNDKALKNIYHLKGRPSKNPLIVHCASVEQVLELVEDEPKDFFKIAETFWPGPLTLVMKAKKNVSQVITAGLPTIGVRIPNHKETLDLIYEVGPIAAPSANLSGKPSSTKASHLETDFGFDFPVLEGESPSCGIESTIIGWIDNRWQLLRLGFVEKEAIEKVVGDLGPISNLQICPGTQFKHYSPDATLFSDSNRSGADAMIGFENREYETNLPFYSLGNDFDSKTIANRLFSVFRQIDRDHRSNVWIDANLPNEGLFEAILERIYRSIQK
jgi:L-threonylcarbamoyladenylate synthase